MFSAAPRNVTCKALLLVERGEKLRNSQKSLSRASRRNEIINFFTLSLVVRSLIKRLCLRPDVGKFSRDVCLSGVGSAISGFFDCSTRGFLFFFFQELYQTEPSSF